MKLKLQYFGHLMQRTDSLEKTLMLGKIEGGGEGDDRGWDGWMASPTWQTGVWVSSRSWWWTGKPGMMQSMGSQRVGHNWVTELNSACMRWAIQCSHVVPALLGFPGKESASHCRRSKRHSLYPYVGKIPWRRKWQPTPVFLPGQRSLVGYSPFGYKESDIVDHTCMQTAWSRTGREHEYMLKEYLRGRDSCLAALIREGMRWTGRMCVLFWIGWVSNDFKHQGGNVE